MNLTSPSRVRALLDRLEVRPSKVLGQNFLIDRNILDILLEAADVSASDHVLEVGPGLGVVTERLVADAGRVTAVEKDPRLAAYLRDAFRGAKNLELVHGDILEADLDGLARSGMNKVVSNLPYATGNRVLMNLASAVFPPELMAVTVQLEVAQRLSAGPGAGDFGLLSVWLQSVYEVKTVKTISPSCFWPAPDVRSAIVLLKKHGRFPMEGRTAEVFRDLTRHAFEHRRKQMAAIFRRLPVRLRPSPALEQQVFRAAGIDGRARPESLSVETWWRLSRDVAGAESLCSL